MTEPVVSRQALRRSIGRAADMTFYKRYSAAQINISASDTLMSIGSTDLTQVDHFWANGYVFIVETSGERHITDFTAQDDRLHLEYAIDSMVADTTNHMEITEVWSPTQIHEAINRAIWLGGQYWPDIVVNDSELVFQEDRMTYDLTTIADTIWNLHQIWAERSSKSYTGYADSTATTSGFPVQDIDLSDVTTDWLVSIYDGTGAGQVRQVGTVTTATSNLGMDTTVADLDVAPDSLSKIRIWDAATQEIDWYKIANCRTDAVEHPSKIYFNQLMPSVYGYRIRLIYSKLPAALDADTDETCVPQEYIVPKSLSILHDMRVGDNRADRQMHANLAEYFDQISRDVARRLRRQSPTQTIMSAGPSVGGVGRGDGIDPLGWSG